MIKFDERSSRRLTDERVQQEKELEESRVVYERGNEKKKKVKKREHLTFQKLAGSKRAMKSFLSSIPRYTVDLFVQTTRT